MPVGGDTVQSTAPGPSFLPPGTITQSHTTTSNAGPFQQTGGFWAGLEGAAIFEEQALTV